MIGINIHPHMFIVNCGLTAVVRKTELTAARPAVKLSSSLASARHVHYSWINSLKNQQEGPCRVGLPQRHTFVACTTTSGVKVGPRVVKAAAQTSPSAPGGADDGAVIVRDDLDRLIQVLPVDLRDTLLQHPRRSELLEVVLDLGRRPEARFLGNGGGEFLREAEVTREDLAAAENAVGQFGGDNRAGVEGTLHRISAIRNRRGAVIGLTCRVGRAVTGHIDMIRDVLPNNQSILFLGRPGVGKTTVIREMARVLADELKKRVVIVDTSNEIGGDGDVPHPAIGGARRMQVPDPSMQHRVMVEAVENHMPEVVIVDEIGTEAEALACRTIAERGVMLVGTAHGQMLENLIKNPTLSDLVGGVQSVTLGDEEARVRGTQKSVLERKAPSTFPIVLEMRERNFWVAHQTDKSVDALLHGRRPYVEVRKRDDQFNVIVERRLYQGNGNNSNGSTNGNGRQDSDFDSGNLWDNGLVPLAAANGEGSSSRSKQSSANGDAYMWAARLGPLPDKDALAERNNALSAPSFVSRGGARAWEWEEETFDDSFGASAGFVTAWPTKRGSKRGPRGVRPR